MCTMERSSGDAGQGNTAGWFPADDHSRRQEIYLFARRQKGSVAERLAACRQAEQSGGLSEGPLPSEETLRRWLAVGDSDPAEDQDHEGTDRDRARLSAVQEEFNTLAAALTRGEAFDGQEAEHRNLLKAIKRARDSGDSARMNRTYHAVRKRCSKYRGLIENTPGVEIPDRRTDAKPEREQPTKPTLPPHTEEEPEAPSIGYGARVAFDQMPKPELDARIRAILVTPYLQGAVTSEECAGNWRKILAGEHSEDTMLRMVALPDEAQQYANIDGGTIRRWARKVRKAQEKARSRGLQPPPVHEILRHRKPESSGPPRKRTEEVDELIKELFLDNPGFNGSNVADVLEHLHGMDINVRTVQRSIAEISDWERALARGGPSAYDQMLRAKLLREVPYPNHTWLMDHSYVIQEVLAEAVEGVDNFDFQFSALLRQWDSNFQPRADRIESLHMTVIKDACTRFPVAVRLWPGVPTTRETLVALWEAAMRYGLPERLYTDNGADFTSNNISAVLHEVGIYHVLSLPYTPEGRGKVERFFRTIKERILPHITGYQGGRHDLTWHDEELFLLPDVEERVGGGIDLLFSDKVHSRTGRKPREHFESEVGARGIPPEPSTLLALLIAEDDVIKREPGVRFRNRWYHAPELASIVNRTPVRLHFDPYRRDAVHVSVRDATGAYRYLCRAEAYLGGDGTPDHSAVRAAEMAWIDEQRALNKAHSAEVRERQQRDAAKCEGRRLADEFVEKVEQVRRQLPPPRPQLPPGEQLHVEDDGDDEPPTPPREGFVINPLLD